MVVALGGIPNRPLPVTAERIDFGGNVGSRWGEVTVTVSTGRPERSQLVGYFGVDYGTALVGDADALSDRRVEVELRQQIERGGRFAVGTCRVWGRDSARHGQLLGRRNLSRLCRSRRFRSACLRQARPWRRRAAAGREGLGAGTARRQLNQEAASAGSGGYEAKWWAVVSVTRTGLR
jgi:hypothetical protein